MQRALPNGLAGATEYGLLRAKGDFLIILDGDGTHNPADIQKLLEKVSTNCIAVASRYKSRLIIKNSFQEYFSSMFNFFVTKYLKTGLNDNLGGYYALYRKVAIDLIKEDVFIGHGDYFIRLILAARKLKFEIVEIPVVFRARYSGVPTKSRFWMLRKYLVTIFELKKLR
jgi:glycosyltransferase involved in cell wall biosynthesis